MIFGHFDWEGVICRSAEVYIPVELAKEVDCGIQKVCTDQFLQCFQSHQSTSGHQISVDTSGYV